MRWFDNLAALLLLFASYMVVHYYNKTQKALNPDP